MTPSHTAPAPQAAFGGTVSDHMLTAVCNRGSWSDYSIGPFEPISLSPTALGLHYGQSIFEGMKAFRMVDGSVSIFRIDRHWQRFGRSAQRMCMPVIPEQLFTEGLKALVGRDSAWVPEAPEASLYIRPFLFATEARFGVAISEEYLFNTFTGPVQRLYAKGLRVKVEDRYIRAAPGGVGAAKCAGNYGGALYPTQLAKEAGFDQVLWTDGSDELNIEESGTMNVAFVIGDTLVTPALSDTILDGVTRDSFLTIARAWGMPVEERKISAWELVEASGRGTLTEAFGFGTAAVVAPIGQIAVGGKEITLPELTDAAFCRRAKQYLSDIRRGLAEDLYGWNTIIQG
ncbi:branched-chain amino acid aminotransferase [Flaviaesturariibacter flavus]|uniref:branched-chain-amino-acid transaminase n=1 Tax=Flaviaesturariibacter flavus TaxID=2502780 RepID=A0A4R1BK91_9BACT|nr:branched-chain amino acid aminotransferase [Flaviaesturariibacter flavus]TCJ17781.1 branched-chain amino acid aminotransferase [Flaviaesturariibacter flavus]